MRVVVYQSSFSRYRDTSQVAQTTVSSLSKAAVPVVQEQVLTETGESSECTDSVPCTRHVEPVADSFGCCVAFRRAPVPYPARRSCVIQEGVGLGWMGHLGVSGVLGLSYAWAARTPRERPTVGLTLLSLKSRS